MLDVLHRLRDEGNTVRVDFDYYQHSPVVWNNPPPGAVAFAAVSVGGLAPGAFRVEGWAKPKDGSAASQQYFARDIVVAPSAAAIEFYSPQNDHYFITAGVAEIARLDSGAQPGWRRTGQRFKVWLRPEDAPPGALAVYRFYAAGPGSHFYTLNAGECEWLKRIEQTLRTMSAAAGIPYLGWSYEGIAFYSMPGHALIRYAAFQRDTADKLITRPDGITPLDCADRRMWWTLTNLKPDPN